MWRRTTQNCSNCLTEGEIVKAADKCRTGIPGVPGLSKVVNKSAWGESKATERYGGTTRTFPPPEDKHAPQRLGDPNNLQGPNYNNDVNADSWLRGGGAKGAEGNPNFDPGYKGKRQMAIERQKTKQDTRKPIDTQAHSLRGGGYEGPRIKENRSDITQVAAYEPGHKGKKQKLRPRWPY